MDAAHNLKKIALFLAPALLLAANALAAPGALLVNNAASTSIQFASNDSGSVSVTSTGDAITFTVPPSSIFNITTSGLTTPSQLQVRLAGDACLLSSNTNPKSCTGTITLSGPGTTATISVTVTAATSGGGGTVISANPTSVSLNAAQGQTDTKFVTLTTTSNSSISFTVSPPNGNFTVTPTFGSVSSTSQAVLTVTSTVVPNGFYQGGTITITPTVGAAVTIPVTLTVGGSGSSTITVTPNNLFFAFPGGPTATGASISSTNGNSFFASASSNGGWLVFGNGSTTTSGLNSGGLSVQVLASAAQLLSPGTYFGTVTVTNQADFTFTTLTFTLSVGGSSVTGFTASPASLSFPTGGNPQTVNISCSTCGSNSFTANPQTDSGGSWLFVQNSGIAQNLPAQLIVSVNTLSLASGTYTGRINVQTSNGTAQIPVTLVVGSGGGVTGGLAAPTALTFAYQAGTTLSPPLSFILVNGTGPITIPPASVQQQPINFFSATGTGTAPGRVGVSVVSGLSAGTYNGSFTVSDDQGSQQITVTLNVTNGPTVVDSAGTVACIFQLGISPCSPTTVSFAVSDNSNLPLTVTPSASWVSVTCTSTTTPANCLVSINPSGLASGLNSSTLAVTAAGAANASYTIPVVVLVLGSSGGGSNLTLSASSLAFAATAGGSTPASQTLSVSASTVTNFNASVSNPSSCLWLSISPSGSQATNANITVSVNQAGLAAGQYSCSLTLVANGVTTIVPVNLTVSAGTGGNVTVSPSALSFTAQAGNSPGAQQLNVTSASGATGITFTTSATSTGNWLSVNFSTAITPVPLIVSVNSGNLQAGTYNGTITITPTGGTAVSVPVTLTVTPAVSITASPTSLSFTYIAGGALPAAQQVQVSGNGGALTFTATASSSGNWLIVNPTTGTTPSSGTAPLTVTVNPTNLNVNQTYTGTITVAGSGGAAGSTTVTVTLTITAPLPTITSVTNGASFNTGAISAGEVITIFGTAMGPTTGVSFQLDSSGKVPTTVGGVQVLVGGYPAPVLFARNDQVSAIVPYEISSPFIANPNVVVKFLGQSSNGISLSQVASAPGIFTANSSGSGPGAILNANLSLNGPAAPAVPANKGDIVVIYMTGEGQTNPAGVSGKVTGNPTIVNGVPFTPQPLGRVAVTIDGQPANVVFYGEAPGIVSGVMQVNVQVPVNARSGDLPVVVTVGNANSQTTGNSIGAVTVSVK